MAARPRSLDEAFQRFLTERNAVLRQTITRLPLRPEATYKRHPKLRAFSFGGEGYALLRSKRFGHVCLFLGQVCDSSLEDGEHRLHTLSYRYSISPEGVQEPSMRWEYTKCWPGENDRWCRHHIQLSSEMMPSPCVFPLDELHTPTGFVPMEEVIRFCITELEVKSIEPDWHDVLVESYKRFHEGLPGKSVV